VKQSKVWPYLLVLVSGAIWGVTFSIARILTQAGVHPLGLTFWQGFGGGLVLLAICAARSRWPRLTGLHFKFYVILGLLGTALPGALFFYAASHVPAGILAITVTTVPLLTYGGAWLLGIDRFSVKRMSGIAVGLFAILLLVGPETSLPDRSMVFWVLVVLVASLFYTFENIYVAVRVPGGTDMIALLAGMLLVAGLLILPLVLSLNAFASFHYPWGKIEWLMLAMMVISSLAYGMFLLAIQMAGPVFASQTAYVVTLSGVLWGILLFNESHSVWVWLALGSMLSGLALVTPTQRQTA